jgi:hypothetical protein
MNDKLRCVKQSQSGDNEPQTVHSALRRSFEPLFKA